MNAPDGLRLETLEPGTTLNVETDNSHYRLVIVDGLKHLVLISGGTAFPEQELVRIAGATCRGSGLRPGRIIVGLNMEMLLGGLRIKSSIVRSVSIAGIPGERPASSVGESHPKPPVYLWPPTHLGRIERTQSGKE